MKKGKGIYRVEGSPFASPASWAVNGRYRNWQDGTPSVLLMHEMILPGLLRTAGQGVHCIDLRGGSHRIVIKNMYTYCNRFPAKVIPGNEP